MSFLCVNRRGRKIGRRHKVVKVHTSEEMYKSEMHNRGFTMSLTDIMVDKKGK